MPPARPYKFNPAQCNYLKNFVDEYMDAEDVDDGDSSDDFPACKKFLNSKYESFVEKFKLADAIAADAPLAEKITDSLNSWFAGTARRTRNRTRIEKPLEITARQLFHEEKWPTVIKPLVISILGTDDSNHPQWLKTMQLEEKREWLDQSPEGRANYKAKARAINNGTQSQEAKSLYAEYHMQEKIQKVVNEIAKIFDVHMIALTVRKPHNKEAMLAIIEDQRNRSFLKSLPKREELKWTPQHFLAFDSGKGDRIEKPTDENGNYKLMYASNGEPILPDLAESPYLDKWRTVIGEYMRYWWGRANGSSVPLKPPYTLMATQGVSRYIDAQYLPDPSDLPEGETFVICKPATMKMSVFRPWVACLCKRQQARNSVDPDMKIFRFKAYDKETGALLISHSDRESEPETPNQVPKKKASKARGGKRGQQKASAGRKGKGLQVKGKGKPGQKKHSTAAPDAETVGNDETGLPTTPPDSKSPAFAGIGWDAKMKFLKTLSENFAFQELCSWLSKQQSQSSPICPRVGSIMPLHWADWTWASKFLPATVHTATLGRKMIRTYIAAWTLHSDALVNDSRHVEHLLLATGLLLRDIHTAHFYLRDPADEELPTVLPDYVVRTQWDLKYSDSVESLLSEVLGACQVLSTKQAPTTNAPNSNVNFQLVNGSALRPSDRDVRPSGLDPFRQAASTTFEFEPHSQAIISDPPPRAESTTAEHSRAESGSSEPHPQAIISDPPPKQVEPATSKRSGNTDASGDHRSSISENNVHNSRGDWDRTTANTTGRHASSPGPNTGSANQTRPKRTSDFDESDLSTAQSPRKRPRPRPGRGLPSGLSQTFSSSELLVIESEVANASGGRQSARIKKRGRTLYTRKGEIIRV